jgi:hypothetical protein
MPCLPWLLSSGLSLLVSQLLNILRATMSLPRSLSPYPSCTHIILYLFIVATAVVLLAGRVEQQSRYIEEIKGLLVPTMVDEHGASPPIKISPQEQGLGKPSALRSTRQLQNPTGLFGGYGPGFGTGTFNLGVDTLETLTAKVNGLLTKFGNIKAGPQGEQGTTGPQGPPGQNGNDGAQGLTATQGQELQMELKLLKLDFVALKAQTAVLVADLTGVEKKVQCVSANSTADDLFFVGCDVHVENGDSSGDTLSANGKGNLVIGFNEEAGCGGPGQQCNRTGSHNIVVGKGNAYSASGGIVSGSDNILDGDLAVLLGGRANDASGYESVVAGGADNDATGVQSVIAGGALNDATGRQSVVAGGQFNDATGVQSVVAGGFFNNAIGYTSAVAGGSSNDATGLLSVVAGGFLNNATGKRSVVAGGGFNNATGVRSVVVGGRSNDADGDYSVVAGGRNNDATGHDSVVAGGGFNYATGSNSLVAGGRENDANGQNAVVAGGFSNTATGLASVVAGGRSNDASANFSFVSGMP